MKNPAFSKRFARTAFTVPVIIALMSGATSCTTNTWQKNEKVCSAHPTGPGTKYGPAGHMNTSYVVARIAGNDEKTSFRLSHFSQAPDDLAFLYSAPSVAIWGLFPPALGYRHRVVNVLHSLHGEDTAGVARRRQNLKKLISEMKQSGAEDWKIGFLIHAYGDSYAHVKPGPNGEVGYGELVGHGFDRTVKPDHIEHHVEKYGEYVENLYAALATKDGDPKELHRFIKEVKAAASGPNAEDAVEHAIVCFKFDKATLLEFELQDVAKRTKDWNEEIKFPKVNKFLGEVKGRL